MKKKQLSENPPEKSAFFKNISDRLREKSHNYEPPSKPLEEKAPSKSKRPSATIKKAKKTVRKK